MNRIVRNTLVAVLMFITSGVALALRPTERVADEGPKVNLEAMIPKQFGNWQELSQQTSQIVNPQQKQMLDKIYTQTLSRTYVNAKGQGIMLSIAYGADQSDAKQLHYPEVCYPAQGFQVVSTQAGTVQTNFGDIRVKRMLTTLGNRSEPLTYWATVGNQVVMGGKETKLAQLSYGFKGKVPDGLLFRVSSITQDAYSGYVTQQDFVRELVAFIPEKDRLKLAGLPAYPVQH